MYAGLVGLGFLAIQGINTLFGDSLFGKILSGVAGLGPITIGMVKVSFAGKDQYEGVIEILRTEVTKLISSRELFHSRLANWKLARYLGLPWGTRTDGRKWDTISTILKGERHITLQDFETFKKTLTNFFGDKSKNCIKYIEGFTDISTFRRYSKQQWHLHNPDLKADFFSGIANKVFDESNVVPSYWYGFMCSDASVQSGLFKQSEGSVRDHKYRYDITIELQQGDKGLIEKFCNDIGLDPLKIKSRTREKWGNIYHHSYISFGCRDMIDDLNDLKYSSSKELRKVVPDYIMKSLEIAFKSLNRKYIGPIHIASTIYGKIALVWLRGAYDGDGHSDRTELGSASRQYLESIRRTFKIRHPVRPHPSKPNFWILSLGARLFNAMTSVCMEYGLGLERKNKHFSESREALDILKETLEDLNVDRVHLQDLVFQFRQYELVRMFGTTTETFRKLLGEWCIKLPARGYWSSNNKDKFLGTKQTYFSFF